MVVAGAGTGKTMTLVHRLAWLIQRGVPGNKVVLLTFTRKAAEEMRRRAWELVGKQATLVRAGTFHAFAVKALRRYAPRIGFDTRFTVLDERGAREYMGLARGLVAKSDLDAKHLPDKRTLKSIISRWLVSGRPLRAVLEKGYPAYIREEARIEHIALAYQERKQAAGVMDFDDLLLKLDMLLATDPSARDRLARDCEHILVDEYQDTDYVQARIAHQLSSVHGNIMAVGDDAQGIYGWRGAEVGNMLNFSSAYADCTTMMLEDNYRSTQQVLDLANALLSGASVGYQKDLRSHTAEGPLPVVKTVADDYAEAEFVAEQVLKHVRAGERLGDIAVLFRSALHANVLQVTLQREGVPFRVAAGGYFADARHIRDVVAILRIASNDQDELAWFRVLQFFRGVGPATAARIVAAMVTGDAPEVDLRKWEKKRFADDITSLRSLLSDLHAFEDGDLPSVLKRTLEWYGPHMEQLYADDYKKRQLDFASLVELAKRRRSLEDLIADLALDPKPSAADGEGSEQGERLTLSTVHSAKGLEWQTVFVLSMVDGRFPMKGPLDDPDEFEEERRVLYVALTRAKRHLTIMRHRRPEPMRSTCRLLEGIPSKLFDEKPDRRYAGQRFQARARRSGRSLELDVAAWGW